MVQDADETRYLLASDRFSMERSRTENIISRASQGIAVSGTLMALFLGLGNSAITNLKSTNPSLPNLRLSLIVGLILFGIDFLVFFYAQRFVTYRFDPDPAAITNQLAGMTNPQLMRQLTSNIVDATIFNHGLNDFKTGIIRIGYYLLGVSILAVLVFGIGLVMALNNQ